MRDPDILRGFEPRTEAERRLLSAARLGEECALAPDLPPQPAPGAEPDPAVTVRAGFLRALILAEEHDFRIHESGLRLRGALVLGLLNLAGCRIRHILSFRCCRFDAPLMLRQAEARSLAFDGSAMPGFYADRLSTTGSLYLRGNPVDGPFVAGDSVSLVSAHIGGDLRLRAGRFTYAGRLAALAAEALGARRERLDEYHAAVSLHKAVVEGTLDLREAELGEGVFDLALTTLHTLRVFQEDVRREFRPKDAAAPRSAGDRLILDGLVYRHIPVGLAGDADTLRRFLMMQIDEHLGVARFEEYRRAHERLAAELGERRLREVFDAQNKLRPQSFEHLARVLREMGYEEVARRIAVFKQLRRRRARGEFSTLGWLIHGLFGLGAGFGYRPLRAVSWLMVFWLIGAGLASSAYTSGAMAPADAQVLLGEAWRAARDAAPASGGSASALFAARTPDYPRFEALAWSADLLLPFVRLHQEDAWAADPGRPAGRRLHYYSFAHIALGWVLSALAIAGVTGMVQRQ